MADDDTPAPDAEARAAAEERADRPGCLGWVAGFYLWCWVLHWLFGTPVPWPF